MPKPGNFEGTFFWRKR